MVSALSISFQAYVVKTEKKLAEIGDSCKENAKTLDIKVAAEIDKVRSQLNIDIGQLTTRCEAIERKVENLESRFQFDPEVAIVEHGMPESQGENIMQKCENLVTEALGSLDVQVVRAKRLVSRNNKPGIVKVELHSQDEKKKVLRQKMKLKQTDTYKET